ncbi:PEP-CTERM sorting domain-containing protein [Akkermansiaceae bacterium]|nr:PEP-CTERM sorting domain-containing protein [Akkermansiaceae bacterium]
MKLRTSNLSVAVLLLGSFPCGAAVIYDPERDSISPRSGGVPVDDHTLDLRRLDFDLNNDGRVHISFNADSRDTLRITGPSTTHYLHNTIPEQWGPEVLPEGFEIGILPDAASLSWVSIGENSGIMNGTLFLDGGTPFFFGKWSYQTGYLGIRFEADDGDHYAYLQITGGAYWQSHIDRAWESEPNQSILAGAIPEPATPLLMMLGSLGLFIRKR